MAYSDETLSVFKILADKPVAYHPGIARAMGGVKCAIMLCQLMYWSGKERNEEGWICKTQSEMEEETALSREEADSAAKQLVKLGALERKVFGVPPRTHYRIDYDAIMDKLLANQFAGNPICGKPTNQFVPPPANRFAGFPQIYTITENTTESTTESTTSANAARQPRRTVKIEPIGDQESAIPFQESENGKQIILGPQAVEFGWLKELCVGNYAPARIGRTAKQLVQFGVTEDQREKFKSWWTTADFRGVKGQHPTPEQVWQMWPVAMQWTPGTTANGLTDTWALYQQLYREAAA